MVLLLDTKKTNGTAKCLLEKVNKVVLPEELKEFESFETLFQFLLGSWDDSEIVVLRATSSEELLDFKRIRGLIRDIQVLLVIPDRNPDTLFHSHLLHPRYLAYEDGNFDDLSSVLEKILKRKRRQPADLRK